MVTSKHKHPITYANQLAQEPKPRKIETNEQTNERTYAQTIERTYEQRNDEPRITRPNKRMGEQRKEHTNDQIACPDNQTYVCIRSNWRMPRPNHTTIWSRNFTLITMVLRKCIRNVNQQLYRNPLQEQHVTQERYKSIRILKNKVCLMNVQATESEHT